MASSDNGNDATDAAAADETRDDAFLSNFTFANGNTERFCDCDECGISVVPPTIAAAVARYKRQKLENFPIIRSQTRTLVKRQDSISVYDYHLPLHVKEPLVEFSNSHRLVWVRTLVGSRWDDDDDNKDGSDDETNVVPSILRAIGQGIVGSATEESSRQALPWKQGRVYFIPSNGGKAVGWVHDVADDAAATVETSLSVPSHNSTTVLTTVNATSSSPRESNNDASSPLVTDETTAAASSSKTIVTRTAATALRKQPPPVILRVAKLPMASLEATTTSNNKLADDDASWSTQLRAIFEQAILSLANDGTNDTCTDNSRVKIPLELETQVKEMLRA